jgi:steroid delta-isomerase-like uncharacterized protein
VEIRPIEQLIREYFDAFNRRDIAATMALLSQDVIHDINEGEREVGKAAFLKFKKHMDECYRENISQLVIMTNGNRGCAEFCCSGTYLKTDTGLPAARGQTYAIPAVAIFEANAEGLICRISSYYSLSGWIQSIS